MGPRDIGRECELGLGEFIAMMAVVAGRADPRDAAKVLFVLCDLDCDGTVSRKDLSFVLDKAHGAQQAGSVTQREEKECSPTSSVCINVDSSAGNDYAQLLKAMPQEDDTRLSVDSFCDCMVIEANSNS